MKNKIYFITLFCSLVALAHEDAPAIEPVVADEQIENSKSCEFKIECRQNHVDYVLEYKVLGDGCEGNAAGEFILVSDEKRTALSIKGLPLKRFDDKGNTAKICEVDGEKYPAVDLGDNRIAILLRIDNRPSLDRLGGLIVDLRRKKVIKVEENFGEIKNQHFAMLKSNRGFKTRLAKDRLKDVACDCDAAVIDAWKEITAYADVFKTKWVK